MIPNQGTGPHSTSAPPTEPPVGVLVVDDQILFRQVARLVINATPDFEMLGEAGSGEHGLAAADELCPDLVLVDVRMPGMDGIETAERLRASHPEAVVVLISIDEPPHMPDGVAASGAAELLRKQDFGPAMLKRVWTAHGPPPPS
jgi:DNA-binding NarL/FixJ family response regulator